jgi:hypothetical protein
VRSEENTRSSLLTPREALAIFSIKTPSEWEFVVSVRYLGAARQINWQHDSIWARVIRRVEVTLGEPRERAASIRAGRWSWWCMLSLL